MNKIELGAFRDILLHQRREIERILRASSGDLTVERSADDIEAIQGKQSREASAERIHKLTEELIEVCVALDKVEGGDYGICEVCNEAISLPRLIAHPTARLCRNDQERKERNGQ